MRLENWIAGVATWAGLSPRGASPQDATSGERDPATDGPWWRHAGVQACAGLSTAEASERLVRHGPNRIDAASPRPMVVRIAARFANPLVMILIVASALSAATGEYANATIVIAMVALSVAMDFVQEHRAVVAAARLRESVSLTSQVLRDGVWRTLPIDDVVPGDCVRLGAGDRVPADGVVVDAVHCTIDQGLLTGESFPVEKTAVPPAGPLEEIDQASNCVFTGSSVASGTLTLVVMATAMDTAFGEVAHTIRAAPAPTAFEIDLHRFGMMVMRLTMLLVLCVLLINVALHRPLLDSFLFAIALAVGLTPELLPMVVSVTLARGAIRMARGHVIVKRLASIQNLGEVDVLCTDKTGTLTEGAMRTSDWCDAAGAPSDRVRELAILNSTFHSGLASPLDAAILAGGAAEAGWTKVAEIPFDFERRRVSVIVERRADRWMIVKGAPTDVLAVCTRVETATPFGPAPLDTALRATLDAQVATFERRGLRVLAVASRPTDAANAGRDDERDFILAGFVTFIDPPKEGAADALRALRHSGITVKVITGDSDLVAAHLCDLIGLRPRGVLTGAQIARLDDASLRARVGKVDLFCRVNPMQKNRIVLALRARGHVVAFLGDGVNDAPSLHAADVGITVNTAVDVAREVADIVLLERDLAVVHAGVVEGRRTFANVSKYVRMGTSSNFGNMLSMAVASLFLPFLPMLPTQILLNNVLYDLSELAIPLDRVDDEDIRRPQTLDLHAIRRAMWTFGLLSSLFDAMTFVLLLHVLGADEARFRTGWFIESLLTQILVIFVIRTRRLPWQSRPHPALIGAALGAAALGLMIPYSPLAPLLGFEPPPVGLLGLLAVMVAVYLAMAVIANIGVRRLDQRRTSGRIRARRLGG